MATKKYIAINQLLTSIGLEPTNDLNSPDALMAYQALEFAMSELPYDSTDFQLNIETIPSPVFNYLLALANRRFQSSYVSSELLAPVSEADILYYAKRLIILGLVPNSFLKATSERLFSKYGFSGVIPLSKDIPTYISQTLKTLAAYDFQATLIPSDNYVITAEQQAQVELDLRLAIIANRLLPTELYNKTMAEFIFNYGYTQSELTSLMTEYIYQKALYRLQAALIPDPNQHPISPEDIDNIEATLITHLITPKNLQARALDEVKVELGIEDALPDDELPKPVKEYALYKAAFKHQPTAISRPSKFVISKDDVIRAKALAGQSLPTLTLLNGKGVYRIIDKENTPSVTSKATQQKFRLKVNTDASS